MYLLPLEAFGVVLLVFHVSEYALAWKYMRQELSSTSLLLSGPYCAAMAFAVLEYVIEAVFCPHLQSKAMLWFGGSLVVLGEFIRKYAMVTAKHSFTHSLQFRGHPTKELITWGPYRIFRHPGYFGWLVWAIGTQVLLCNPFCSVAFAALACLFFRRRIMIEEHHLRQQFGDAYTAYAESVATFIPFAP